MYLENSYLKHYGRSAKDGAPIGSGRYPLGSGETPYQRSKTFQSEVRDLEKKGLTEKEIAEALGLKNTTELRARKSQAREVVRSQDYQRAKDLLDAGHSRKEVVEIMGLKNESSLRSLLNSESAARMDKTRLTKERLKDEVDSKKYLDIGYGAADELGVSRERMNVAVQQLVDEGYQVHELNIRQLNNPQFYTPMKVLTKPGVEIDEVYANKDQIAIINEKKVDTGKSSLNVAPVESISSKKVMINYAEDGGTEKDGVIEIRRGAEGLDMGNARYAQVRIGVDGTHYLKGMAVYADDLPDGIDIRFNTNKKRGTPMLGDKDNSVLKPMRKDKDGNVDNEDPFGAAIDATKGKLNIVNQEGDWATWSKTLASQMLSKQPSPLIKRQLDAAKADKYAEYEEIMSVSNPTVKRYLLEKFADGCDSGAVHLKAAAMKGQATHVILPVNSLKPNEIYAPGYKDGERVVLIRYPHGGTFEIPELTVNNSNKEAARLFHDAQDAVGIHHKVAERLSGADFDGDTVLVIPNPNHEIRTSPELKGLKGFDSKSYKMQKGPDGKYPYEVTKDVKENEMGKVSNLITDMTIHGAPAEDVCKAVRHSMVVIDSEKHNLDYKQSFIDNDIAALKRKWQGSPTAGASTLISRAKSRQDVNQRKPGYKRIDPETGELIYKETGKLRRNKDGEIVYDKNGVPKLAQQRSTKMAETKDARTLISDRGSVQESLYAEYANSLKALANKSRKESLSVKDIDYSPSARKTYAQEVASIDAKIRLARKQRPVERKAELIAKKVVSLQIQDNPELKQDSDRLKKIKSKAMTRAREQLGKEKSTIVFTDKEWEAVQAGAISKTKLKEALDFADIDKVRERATPRSRTTVSPAKLAQAKAKMSMGYTQAEVAEQLGVSVSTLNKALRGK